MALPKPSHNSKLSNPQQEQKSVGSFIYDEGNLGSKFPA